MTDYKQTAEELGNAYQEAGQADATAERLDALYEAIDLCERMARGDFADRSEYALKCANLESAEQEVARLRAENERLRCLVEAQSKDLEVAALQAREYSKLATKDSKALGTFRLKNERLRQRVASKRVAR